jgi:hypothetical protein
MVNIASATTQQLQDAFQVQVFLAVRTLGRRLLCITAKPQVHRFQVILTHVLVPIES